jgi:hypothetical protein
MQWAQQQDEAPIEQVGEDSGQDTETLDEAAPPAVQGETTEDVELLDQGPPADDQQDVELLDQGLQAATVFEAPVQSNVSTVPVTTDVAPATSSAPMLPAGFGTGNVHVATGPAGFPVGLEDCHVGAVTGRAYVGVDCGDDNGSTVVGHAPSFEAFPFVVEENFPFDRESLFADRGEDLLEGNVETLVSAALGAASDDNAEPEIRTSGASSVELEQRARDRKPRVDSENGRSKRGNEKRRSGNTDATASESDDAAGRTSAESKHEKKNKGKDRARGGSGADDDKKSMSSDQKKKQGDKKGKKSRDSK